MDRRSQRTEEEELKRSDWDNFSYIPPERSNVNDNFRPFVQLIKLITYILLFLIVFSGSIAVKITSVFFSNNLGRNISNRNNKNIATTLILISLAVPQGWNLIVGLLKALFGGKKRPKFTHLVGLLFIDCLQTIGVCCLSYNVYPFLDCRCVILTTGCVCILPTFVAAIWTCGPIGNFRVYQKVIWKLIYSIMCIIQVSICVIIIALPAVSYKGEIWPLAVGFTLSSLATLTNFVDFQLKNKLINFWMILKRTREEYQQQTCPFSALVKGVVVITFPYIFDREFHISSIQDDKQRYAIYINLISFVVVNYVACLACRLRMQKFSFSLSLSLTTPGAFLLLFLNCNWDKRFWDFQCNIDGNSHWWVYLILSLSYIIVLILTCYVWFPKQLRMQTSEQLFISTLTESPFITESLLLNRKNDTKITIITSQAASLEADRRIPKICACATFWHETKHEMTQLLKSLFRMDLDYSARLKVLEVFNINDPDFYEFESHLFFDDSFITNDTNNEVYFNEYVERFLDVIDQAATSVHGQEVELDDPIKVVTPYGGRLVWWLPGGSKMTLHLKDKTRIRNRKKWSQCMYMYYLLSYPWAAPNRKEFYDKQRSEAERTYILALDGDVDFHPDSVRLLVDKMKNNSKVGAACGRIHPIGKGPLIWYQKFEYSIGHWLQKAAEHVYGCVLCSPGCFSLFRGSALIDDNVIRRYVAPSSTANEYIQFDQSEDRWLCTLLLQQGYKVEYCAAADALTFAPQTFSEFYNQRRRWIPSTMFNLIDLLSSCRRTVKKNDNFSYFYVGYQFLLFISSILGPATVLMMIAGAYNAVLNVNVWQSYLLSIGPAIFYLVICLVTKTNIQLIVSAVLSCLYAIIMMVVTVATIVSAAQNTWSSPNVLFVIILTCFFLAAALLHPQEFLNIIYGLLYYLCIPSGYLLLPLYAICNLHIVSWGTRENVSDDSSNIDTKPISNRQLQHSWLHDHRISFTTEAQLDIRENLFWKQLRNAYLQPIEKTEKQIKNFEKELINLRNSMVLGFVMINVLWMVIVFQLQLLKDSLKDSFFIPIPRYDDEEPERFEPIGLICLGLFSFILILQFIASVIHRWGTFTHLLSSTSLRSICSQIPINDRLKSALEICQRLQAFNDHLPNVNHLVDDSDEIATNTSNISHPDRFKITSNQFQQRFKQRYDKWLRRASASVPVFNQNNNATLTGHDRIAWNVINRDRF